MTIQTTLDDDIAELLHGLESPGGRHLERGVGLLVLRTYGTGRGLNVLLIDGGFDVGRGDIEGTHAGGIHPHAHGVVTAGDDIRAGDTVHLAHTVFHVHAYPVGELQDAHLVLIAAEVKEAEHIARALADVVTGLLDFRRQRIPRP